MCQQANLFQQFKTGELDPKDFIKKSGQCRFCHSLLRIRPKYLDKRLGSYVVDIYKVVKDKSFLAKQIWQEHNKIVDFQKLHYFGIIERVGYCRWKLTYRGLRFARGEIQLPKRVWILNNEVVDIDDEPTDIKRLDSRWQDCRNDFTQDYIPQTKLNLNV